MTDKPGLQPAETGGTDKKAMHVMVIGAIGDAKATFTAYMPDFVATGWGFVSWKTL